VAGFKLICLPLPLDFALGWGTARSFWRFSGGLALALLAGAATLTARGELTAYGEALVCRPGDLRTKSLQLLQD
jgi:hypothetical protein